MLCSDGLSNLVKDEEFALALEKNDLRGACKQLIDLANSRGGDDNITVLILQLHEIN